jgi:hypothetical protein
MRFPFQRFGIESVEQADCRERQSFFMNESRFGTREYLTKLFLDTVPSNHAAILDARLVQPEVFIFPWQRNFNVNHDNSGHF